MSQALGYLQLASLAIFVGLVLERTVHLRRSCRLNPICLGAGRHDGAARQARTLLLFLGVALWAVALLLHVFRPGWHWILWPLGRRLLSGIVASLLGLALVSSGLAVFALALRDLGSSWRLGIDEQHPGPLVTHGIYAVSRNPVYAFFNLYFAGTFLLNGTVIMALFALALGLSLHWQILGEERFLLLTYGQAYEDYRARTGRYIAWQAIVRQVRGSLLVSRAREGMGRTKAPSERGDAKSRSGCS